MVTSRVFRFAEYAVETDASVPVEHYVVCISGPAGECGGTSGFVPSVDACVTWIRGHARDTGHRRYRHGGFDVIRLAAPEGFLG